MADVKISGLPASSVPLAGTEVLPIVQGTTTKQVSVANLTAGRAISATTLQSTVVTGTAPLTVASTTEVANLRSANATSADTSNQVKSNATTGVLQVAGPGATTTRVMTTPNANFTAARTDAGQSFTGDQTLSTGNIVQGTAAKGINFTANIAFAGATSQLLNSYEEGTWTPTVIGLTSAGSGTYSTQTGTYAKVGRLVFVQAYISWTAHTGTGSMAFAGLPYTPAAVNPSATISYPRNIATSVGTVLLGLGTVGQAYIRAFEYVVGGSDPNPVAIDTSAEIVYSMMYMV